MAIDGRLFFSPTDLSGFLGCPHLRSLDRAVAADGLARPHKFEDALRDRA